MSNLKDKLFLKSPSELTNELIFSEEDHKKKRYYSAKVVDNKDPEMHLRVKVRVYALMGNEIPDDDLPWAAHEGGFIGSNIGSIIIPPVGSVVRVYFDNDDIYTPIYTAKVPINNIPEDIKNDYPNNMAFFVTDEGDSLTLNRNTGITTFIHRSGTNFMIDKDGNFNFKSVAGISFESENDISLVSNAGNVNIQAESGYVDLGKGASVPIPNQPLCLANSAPLAICGQAATMKGIARVKK